MTVELTTFGYKTGAAVCADLTVDVRDLPNPFYVPELKTLTGSDAAIAAFFEARPDVQAAVERYVADAEEAIDLATARGADLLRIAVGCTGGQHRSVYVAERLAQRLRLKNVNVRIVHRELTRR